jgi:Acyltransferase family
MSTHTNRPATWDSVFNLIVPRAQFWFLQSLFLMFVISAAMAKLGNGSRLFWFVLCIIAAVLYLLNIRDGFLGRFFPFWIYFVLGVLASTFGDRVGVMISRFAASVVVPTLTFGALAVAVTIGGISYDDRGIFTLALGCAGVVATLILSRSLFNMGASSLGALGKQSFEIYLLHIIFGAGVRVFLDKFLNVDDFFVHLIGGLVFGVFGSIFVAGLMRKCGLEFAFGGGIFGGFLQRKT